MIKPELNKLEKSWQTFLQIKDDPIKLEILKNILALAEEAEQGDQEAAEQLEKIGAEIRRLAEKH